MASSSSSSSSSSQSATDAMEQEGEKNNIVDEQDDADAEVNSYRAIASISLSISWL